MRAGNGLGNGGKRAINLAFELQAVAENFDMQDLALVGPVEDGARGRQTRIVLGGWLGSARGGREGGVTGFGRREAEVGVVGQFFGASAGAFGEVAFSKRLQAPGNAFDEPALVAGAGSLAEEGTIAGA